MAHCRSLERLLFQLSSRRCCSSHDLLSHVLLRSVASARQESAVRHALGEWRSACWAIAALEQAHALNLNVCKRSVEALPVAVARLTNRDGAFCFPPWEVEHARERRSCVPSGFENFTRSRRCAPSSRARR